MDELAGSLVAWHRHLLKDGGAHAPGAREALDDAIDWDRRAVEKSVPHSVERAAYESNLGLALRLRYAYTGNLADLNKAIALHREAVGFADQANPYRHAWLTNLGNALYDRFFVTASLADLDEAIKQYREALRLFEAHPGEAAVRQQHLRSLAGCLITRCSTRADERRAEADRDEAVKALAEVYMLAEGGLEPSATEIAKGVADLLVTQWSGSPASRLPPTASRDHLEELLMQRLFERTRQLDARSAEGFEETVRDLRAARDRTTAGSAGWAILNIHLARALRDRAEASGTSGLLQTAVGTYRNVCRRGQGTSLHYVMEAALEWGTWASGKEKWREAVEAFGYGLNAMEDLSATQEARANKEIWLARARTLSAEGAYAAAQANLPGWAVSSLDRGRAVIMREIMREVQDSKPDAEALLPDAAEPSTRIQFDAKAVARNDRGLILLKRGETAKAIKAFEAAVQADPGDYEAHNNLGRAYHAAGRTVDAVREFERAIDLNPDYPDPYNNLGVYYRQARDLDQAIARYRKALEILPDYAEAHHNLGLALIDAGHMSQGTQHLDIAGQLGVSASRRWQNRVA